MSERTATRTAARIAEGAALAAGVAVWIVCAWLLARTSVPHLHLSGLDQRKYFPARLLARTARFTRGADVLWLAQEIATIATFAVLAWLMPRRVRAIGLGRVGTSVIVAMVLLVTLWFVTLPFGLADLWWQHRYGLGPFNVGAWLALQWTSLGPQAIAVLVSVILLVGFAGRFRRAWWIPSGAAIVAIAALFAFTGGYIESSVSHPLRDPQLQADVAHLEAVEHVRGTPVRVQTVSDATSQVNAFTVGFGPATRVVLWDTLLDGRISRKEIDVVIAHELGHVRSRHIVKAIGWSALVVLPTLLGVAFMTRRRGGLANPENLPLAFLTLAVLALLSAPVQNYVSRRYEAEADWRALNATHDPAAARGLFEQFARTSLEQPNPPGWDYLWLENHPTLMQRIAMTRAWSARSR
ncbi:MAG TPA: M48 family metalloprotease [Gaiellaceae bacterium]|nr:M48 family metalloprotease [Gaiellaceae bacterium]